MVILCDALRFEDLKDPECAALADMASQGAVGVMNCAVAGPKTDVAAILTLAAGQQIPAEKTDALAFNDWELVPSETGEARAAYMRRVGPLDPDLLKHSPDPERDVKLLGLPELAQRGLDVNRLGAALSGAAPPVRTWVCGNVDTYSPDRAAALITVDARGVGTGLVSLLRYDNAASFGLIDDPLAMIQATSEAEADFLVVQAGDLGRLEASRPYLTDHEFHARREQALRRLNILVYGIREKLKADGLRSDLLLISPHPPADVAHKNAWDRLTPILASGPDFPPGLLTSPTTRTAGLVANIDFAPTILALYHVPPPEVMIGRAMQSVPAGSDGEARVAAVARVDFLAGLNMGARTRVLYPLGLICFLLVAAAIVARRRSPANAHWFAPGVIAIMNAPAAMLFAPLFPPPTLLEYGLRILAWMAVLTVVSYVGARLIQTTPGIAAMLLGLGVLVVDTCMGQPLQKDSLFCTYAVSGLRYYGLGNEYLGVVLAYGLLSAFAWLDEREIPYPPAAGQSGLTRKIGLCWLGLALLCGWPGLGANAGSLVATSVGFGIGYVLLMGRKPSWGALAVWTVIGIALALLFGALDAAQNGVHSSHSGAAIQAAVGGRGIPYLIRIVLRKIALNVRLLSSPGVLVGLAATAASLWIAQAFLGSALRTTLRRRPWLTHGLTALGAATLASLLFKDSGVVTVDFIAASVMLFLLYSTVTDAPPQPEA